MIANSTLEWWAKTTIIGHKASFLQRPICAERHEFTYSITLVDKVTNEIRGLSDNTFTGFILGQELYQPVVALVLSQDGRKFSKEHSMLAITMA